MINEERIQLAVGTLHEESLTMVSMVGANVDDPSQPEMPDVVNTPEIGSGQDLQ